VAFEKKIRVFFERKNIRLIKTNYENFGGAMKLTFILTH
jgi:hypothetical protein